MKLSIKKIKENHKKKIVIGLTGGIASGKKTIARILKNFGAHVISADEVYSELIKQNEPLWKKIVKRFGKKVLDENKNIDRKKLSRIVFNHPSKLKALNQITHPDIVKTIKSKIKKTSKKVVVVVAPLLIESGNIKMVDKIWLLNTSKKIQTQRLMKRDKITNKEASMRIGSQMCMEDKIPFAHVLIDNNESFEDVKKQVVSAWGKVIEHLKEINEK